MVSAKVCGYTPGQSQVELRLDQGRPLPAWLELGESVTIQPAEQHQGEPVAPAFVMPSCENNYGFGYVDGTCIQRLRGYRDHLEEIIDSIPEGPLYTHADPGEVERLRKELLRWKGIAETLQVDAEKLSDDGVEFMTRAKRAEADLDRLRAERRRMDEALVACANERDSLRAQLAELEALHGGELGLPKEGWPAYHKRKMESLRDLTAGHYQRKLAEAHALLREASYWLKRERWADFDDAICKKIDAALSASAEPSAPTPQTINGHKINCKAVDDYKPGECSCGAEPETKS